MLKRSSKKLALLLVLSMIATMFIGVGAVSAKSSDITYLSQPSMNSSVPNGSLGAVKVTCSAGSLKPKDQITVELPDDFSMLTSVPGATDPDYAAYTAGKIDIFDNTARALATDATHGNFMLVPAKNSDGTNGLANTDFTVTQKGDDRVLISVNETATPALDADVVFYIYFNKVIIDNPSDGDVIVTLDGPSGTGFPQGQVVVGTVSSNGSVSLSASGTDTSDDEFDFTLRVKESTPGALQKATDSIKLTLPDGFKWETPAAVDANDKIWGEDPTGNISFDVDNDELSITVTKETTTTASCYDIPLKFKVDNEDDIKAAGDVTVKVSGDSTTNISELVVGTYGEYGATISVKNPSTINAGQDEQKIGEIHIKETMKGSLDVGRTITLTLPDEAVWQKYFKDTTATTMDEDFNTDAGLRLQFDSYKDDGHSAKFKVASASNGNDADIKLKDAEIAVEAGYTGDIALTVSGSASITGDKVVVAKAVSTVNATAGTATNVVIGKTAQPAADYTITENIAGALNDDSSSHTVRLTLPSGVTFSETPSVAVTAGDLKIKNIRRAGSPSDSEVDFDIDNDSTTPSTIAVTGIKLKVDRTVAEGAISLKVKGNAVVETNTYVDWSNSDYAAKANIANVATAAGDSDATAQASFVIGSTTYTLNGVQNTMDVAPYIANGRTYMPIRYIANAMGIDDNNILWDGASQTVTLMKGDKVVQMKIGSTNIIINGAAVTMDVAPEITSSRTMLPARFVAQAFGATVGWDESTQTVTLK